MGKEIEREGVDRLTDFHSHSIRESLFLAVHEVINSFTSTYYMYVSTSNLRGSKFQGFYS